MTDDVTRAQAEVELTAAQRESDIAQNELEAALAAFDAAAKRGANAQTGPQERINIAQEAVSEAAAALESTAIVNMEITQGLVGAIESISNAADEDSLLRDPFDGSSQLKSFVDPLTVQERGNLLTWQTQLEKGLEKLKSLESQPETLQGFFVVRIAILKNTVNALERDINVLLSKRASAFAEFQKKNAENFSQASAKREAVLDEFETFVDQFEDVFKNAGLDRLISKRVRPKFERYAKNYIMDEPDILFLAQYVLDGRFIGVLLCFEKYKESTHYEVFKRNTFKDPLAKDVNDNSSFKRILYLDRRSLRKETGSFVPYVREILGFKDINFDNVYIVLDTEVKVDRIYEYSVAGADVPAASKDVDYDLILESKGLLNNTTLGQFSNATLFSWAGALLGSVDLAWVLGLVNEGITFFGRPTVEQSLQTIIVDPPQVVGGSQVVVPKNINDALCIIQESISLFGAISTFGHLIFVLGGLPSEFIPAIKLSIDEVANQFSFEKFRNKLKSESPVFQLVLDIAETKDEDALVALSQLSIELPIDTGTESITTVLGLSKIFKFINDTFIALSYSQEEDSFEKIIEIRALIALNRGEEDPLLQGSQDVRDAVASARASGFSENLQDLYNVDLGSQLGFDFPERNAFFSVKGVESA